MKCLICGSSYQIEQHHLLSGVNRRAAERNRLKIPLCHTCHMRVQQDGRLMLISKAAGQLLYMLGHTRKEFIAEFGQDYLYKLERAEES